MLKKIQILKLRNKVKNCKKCPLWKNKKAVFGQGNINSKIVFIGEAPGKNEALQGKPFVGRAGKLLDELLKISNIKRNGIFITNIVKHRTPNNRIPKSDEIKACVPYLIEQISIIKPKMIVTLGRTATNFIFKKFNFKQENIAKIHGRIFKNNITIIPTYHPAAILRNPNLKKDITNDFKIIKQFRNQ